MNERETLITDLSINAVDGFFYITQKLQVEIRELLTQKREPLSEQEITDLWANKSPANEFECVRLAEKAHGIGGE